MKNKEEELKKMRHSCEHVLTQAMTKLFPGIKMAMGPAIKDGFYFDFEPVNLSGGYYKISEEDFPRIESEMKKIIDKDLPFIKKELSIKEARKLFSNNPYKQELIDEIAKSKQTPVVYWTGKEFVDLCNGPHVKSTGEIGPFKLLSIAGAYWRGDEKNKMLTRIYGTCFFSKKELEKFLWQRAEAKKRDHKKLGVKLDLFLINENIGKGLPLLTPKGTIIRNEILKYEKKLEKEYGFQEVWTPHIARNDLYKKTGHWQHYREVMYAPFGIDNETYVLKPMNCPHHYMIYASKIRSYKDLPIRLSEPGTCYRYEKSGELAGLTRVRALTIDDAHILMTNDQIEEEFNRCIEMIKKVFRALHLNDFYVRLSLADPNDQVKYIADKTTWNKAGRILEKIIKKNNLSYQAVKGEASFYGPKIDFLVKDAMGREWQMSTLQLDLFMAKRLGLYFVGTNGRKKHPAILHRGLTGSLERTIAILIEHFDGAFPLWLSPIQIVIIPVRHNDLKYPKIVSSLLKKEDLRIELDDSKETMEKKIRRAQQQRIPYMIILGRQEENNNTITIRTRDGSQLKNLEIKRFIKTVSELIKTKSEKLWKS